MVEKNDLLWNLAEQCIKQQNNYGYLVPDLFPSKHLFRYRANIERAIEEIRESYIYLSPIRNLNDPFDSSYVVSFEEAKTESHSAEFFYERCYFIKKAEWYGSVKNEMQITGILEKTFTMSDFFNQLAEITRKHGGKMGASVMMELYFKYVYSYVHQNYGFSASFSEKKDNILMWSYYADSHRGVCLEYDPVN